MKSQYVKTNNLRTIRFSCFNQFSLTLLLTIQAYFVCVKCDIFVWVRDYSHPGPRVVLFSREFQRY